MRDEIGHDLAVAVTDGRALGNGDDQVVSAGAVGIAPFAVHAGGCGAVGVISERDERGDISIGDEPHRAARSAVAAIRAAFGNVCLAAKGDASRSPVAGSYADGSFVNEFGHGARLPGAGRTPDTACRGHRYGPSSATG